MIRNYTKRIEIGGDTDCMTIIIIIIILFLNPSILILTLKYQEIRTVLMKGSGTVMQSNPLLKFNVKEFRNSHAVCVSSHFC